jgi:hypothetical protein
MTRWSHDDVALLIEWVKMCAPLFADGASDAAVISALAWQMERDLASRDNAGIRSLVAGWAPAMHQAAAMMRDYDY